MSRREESIYGGYVGNVAGLARPGQLSTDVIHANIPNASFGSLMAGGVDLPFGGGGRYKTIQEQNKPGAPRDYIPIRTFPQTEPGREGAINVQFRQALGFPGMQPMGNAGAFLNNSQFYMGPQMSQMPAGFQNKKIVS